MKIQLFTAVLLMSLFSIWSCKKQEVIPANTIQWAKVDVPGASTIYSLKGNINKEIIAGGLGKIYKTSNQGLTWTVTGNNITAYEIRERGDTLFAIDYGQNDYYSLDNGNSWLPSQNKSYNDLRTSIVTSSKGTIYKVVDSLTFPKQPDKVLMSKDGGLPGLIYFHIKNIFIIYIWMRMTVYTLGLMGGNGMKVKNLLRPNQETIQEKFIISSNTFCLVPTTCQTVSLVPPC